MNKIKVSGYREKKDNLDFQEDSKRQYNTVKAQWELFPEKTIKVQRQKMFEKYKNGVLQND